MAPDPEAVQREVAQTGVSFHCFARLVKLTTKYRCLMVDVRSVDSGGAHHLVVIPLSAISAALGFAVAAIWLVPHRSIAEYLDYVLDWQLIVLPISAILGAILGVSLVLAKGAGALALQILPAAVVFTFLLIATFGFAVQSSLLVFPTVWAVLQIVGALLVRRNNSARLVTWAVFGALSVVSVVHAFL